jgi:hypothetical protein
MRVIIHPHTVTNSENLASSSIPTIAYTGNETCKRDLQAQTVSSSHCDTPKKKTECKSREEQQKQNISSHSDFKNTEGKLETKTKIKNKIERKTGN